MMPMRTLRGLVVPVALLATALGGYAYDPYTGSYYPAIYGYYRALQSESAGSGAGGTVEAASVCLLHFPRRA
jgi:hypothetical protein